MYGKASTPQAEAALLAKAGWPGQPPLASGNLNSQRAPSAPSLRRDSLRLDCLCRPPAFQQGVWDFSGCLCDQPLINTWGTESLRSFLGR